MGQSLKLEPMDMVSESAELANIYRKDPSPMILLSKALEPAVTIGPKPLILAGEGFELMAVMFCKESFLTTMVLVLGPESTTEGVGH
jgi:hypothetical protein